MSGQWTMRDRSALHRRLARGLGGQRLGPRQRASKSDLSWTAIHNNAGRPDAPWPWGCMRSSEMRARMPRKPPWAGTARSTHPTSSSCCCQRVASTRTRRATSTAAARQQASAVAPGGWRRKKRDERPNPTCPCDRDHVFDILAHVAQCARSIPLYDHRRRRKQRDEWRNSPAHAIVTLLTAFTLRLHTVHAQQTPAREPTVIQAAR